MCNDYRNMGTTGAMCAFVGAATLMCATDFPWAVVGAVVMSIGMSVQNHATYILLTTSFPKTVGTAAGWVLGIGWAGSGVTPAMNAIGFQAGWSLLVILTGVSSVVAFCFWGYLPIAYGVVFCC